MASWVVELALQDKFKRGKTGQLQALLPGTSVPMMDMVDSYV